MMRRRSSLGRFVWLALLVIIVSAVTFWFRHLSQKTVATIPDVIIVGTSADYPPFSFKENGKIVGFDIDVAKEICRRLNKQIEIKDVPFELLIPQLQQGYLHFVAAGISPNPERARLVTFTHSYSISNPLVVLSLAPYGPLFKTPADLNKKRVIINQGYNTETFASTLKGATIIRLPTIADAIKALQDKSADVFITAINTIPPIFNQFGKEHFSFFVIPETNENIAIAMSPRYPLLEQEVGFTVNKILQDGTLDELKQKWQIQ